METVEKGNASSLESLNSVELSRQYAKELLQSNKALWVNCLDDGRILLQDISGLTLKQRNTILGIRSNLLKEKGVASAELREILLKPVMALSFRLLSNSFPSRLFLRELAGLDQALPSIPLLDNIFREQVGRDLKDLESEGSDADVEQILASIFNKSSNVVVLACVLAERSWHLQGVQKEVFGPSFESARSILLSAAKDNSVSVLQDIGFSDNTLESINRLAGKVCLAPGDVFYSDDCSGYLSESLQLRVSLDPALCGVSMDQVRYSLGLQLLQAVSAQNRSCGRLGLQMGKGGHDLNQAMTEYLTMALFYEAGFPLFPSDEKAARAALSEMAQFCPIYFNVLAKLYFGEDVEEADLARSVEIFKKFML